MRRADHSSRGVLPSVVCLSVIVKPRRPWPSRGCCAMGGGSPPLAPVLSRVIQSTSDHFNIILPSAPRSYNWCLPSKNCTVTLCVVSFLFPVDANIRRQVAVNAVFMLHIQHLDVDCHDHETCSFFVSKKTFATRYLKHLQLGFAEGRGVKQTYGLTLAIGQKLWTRQSI